MPVLPLRREKNWVLRRTGKGGMALCRPRTALDKKGKERGSPIIATSRPPPEEGREGTGIRTPTVLLSEASIRGGGRRKTRPTGVDTQGEGRWEGLSKINLACLFV